MNAKEKKDLEERAARLWEEYQAARKAGDRDLAVAKSREHSKVMGVLKPVKAQTTRFLTRAGRHNFTRRMEEEAARSEALGKKRWSNGGER